MATLATQDSPARSMGHLALHYGTAADGPAAAKLLNLIGFVETQMIPFPSGNFYRFVVDQKHYSRGDGIIYLSAVPDAQRKLVETVRDALKVGKPDEHESVRGMRDALATDPEVSFHVGFLFESLEALEKVVLDLQDRAQNDPDLKGHLNFGFNRARPGNAEVDARLDASPVFSKIMRYAYGSNGIQVFIGTDLLKSGTLGEDMVLELNYVFPGYDKHVLSIVEM